MPSIVYPCSLLFPTIYIYVCIDRMGSHSKIVRKTNEDQAAFQQSHRYKACGSNFRMEAKERSRYKSSEPLFECINVALSVYIIKKCHGSPKVSHFTKIKTNLKDAAALKLALADLGFKTVETHDTAQNLYGYQGDVRRQKAEIIIRREFIGAASNDIGFKRSDDGSFEAIISEFDSYQHNEIWLHKLKQRYSYHVVVKEMESQGYEITERVEAGTQQKIQLTFRRS